MRRCLGGGPYLSWRWLDGGAFTPDGPWGAGCRISAAPPYCWPGAPARDAVQAKPLQGWLQPPAVPTRPTKRVRPCTSTPNPQNTGAQTPGHTLQCPHFQSKTTMQPPPPTPPHAGPVGCVPSRNKDRLCFTSHMGAGSSPRHHPTCEAGRFSLHRAQRFVNVGARAGAPQNPPGPSHAPNSHPRHLCPAFQVALGDQEDLEVPLSEMEQCH